MKHSTRTADLKVNGQPIDEAIAAMIAQLDNQDIDLEKMQIKVKAFQQLNNHHKTVCDILRVELQRDRFDHELELEKAKLQAK